MSLLVALPVIIAAASVGLSILSWRVVPLQRVISAIAALAILGTGIVLLVAVDNDGVQVANMGDWPAPFGIVLVADLFSAMMVIVVGVIATVSVGYSFATIDARRERYGYWILVNALTLGICGAFLSGDLFNLYVWFEVMLIASFVLLALGNERPQIESAIKYVTLNLVSSVFFLSATGLVYGMAGTLNLADLSVRIHDVDNTALVTAVAMLFVVAFGIKSAVFPLFFWLPASYHTPPAAVSALFAGLLTKVGVYAMIRVFTLVFTGDGIHTVILVIGVLTMLSGVLGALAQHEFRRILSFHIVSQIGYMLVGLAIFTPLALAGAIFYVVHHIFVKTALFLVSGVTHHIRGSYELRELGGIYSSHVVVAILFAIPALSLAGIPPFSGFFAKLIIIRSGFEASEYLVAAIALLVGLMTVMSMAKIWLEVFWKPRPAGGEGRHHVPTGPGLLIPIACLALITIAIGIGAEPFFSLSSRAAEQLLEPEGYVEAVLGGGQ